ncbi:MAG: hypothetical protein WAL59_31630, partial [Roseiarcus sp.]
PKPRTHNIWYTCAWLTVRSGETVSDPAYVKAAWVYGKAEGPFHPKGSAGGWWNRLGRIMNISSQKSNYLSG